MATQEITGITIEKGTDFTASFLVDSFDGNPLDLTNYTIIAKIRKYPSSPTAKTFSSSVLGNTGYIAISMNDTDTRLLKAGRNYFDILLTNNYETFKVVKGTIMVEDTASL